MGYLIYFLFKFVRTIPYNIVVDRYSISYMASIFFSFLELQNKTRLLKAYELGISFLNETEKQKM